MAKKETTTPKVQTENVVEPKEVVKDEAVLPVVEETPVVETKEPVVEKELEEVAEVPAETPVLEEEPKKEQQQSFARKEVKAEPIPATKMTLAEVWERDFGPEPTPETSGVPEDDQVTRTWGQQRVHSVSKQFEREMANMKKNTRLRTAFYYDIYKIDGKRGTRIFDWDPRKSPCATIHINLDDLRDACMRGYTAYRLSDNRLINKRNVDSLILEIEDLIKRGILKES